MQSDVVSRFVFLFRRYRIKILVTLFGAIHGTVMRTALDIVCLIAGN